MANKNLIRRMRQLLILVLILAMTMSFATMTAMADKPSDPDEGTNNISAAIKVGKDFKKGEEVTLIFHIAEDNDVRILATSNGAYLKFDMPTEFFSSNGIKTGDQISFETSLNRSGVITVGKHEGNDGGSENEGSIDNGRNNYEGTVAFNTTSLKLEATKTLDGNAPKDDEVFSFTLKNGETEVETAVNNNSNISFKELTFKEAGTYTYTISEVKGDDADITYDETVYTVEVKVTVSDDGNKLVATPTYKKAGEVVQEAVFANTTKSPEVPEGPAPASLSLTAKKTLDGNAPKDDEVFSFTLKNGETEVETAVNNNSNISFKELTFKEAGTYTYTISEVKGDDADITYDETVYTVEVKVTVSDDGNKLVAKPTYKKAGEVVQEAVFANTTKESGNGGDGNGGDGNGGNGGQLPPDQNLEDPDTPNTPAEPVEPSEKPLPDDKHTVTEVPKTGDAVANALLFNLLLLSISALAGTVFYLRRKMTDR